MLGEVKCFQALLTLRELWSVPVSCCVNLATYSDLLSTQVYGATYLQKLLEPLLRTVITSSEWQHVSFEVDPTRFEIQGGKQMYLFVNMIPSVCKCTRIPFSLLQIFFSYLHTFPLLPLPDPLIVSAILICREDCPAQRDEFCCMSSKP